jgi:glycosyltransferase involved in cell wall biosynthesis
LHAGGTERLVVELTRRLHSEVPTAVCCLDDEGIWGEALAREGIVVRALRRAPGFQPTLGRRIALMARQHQANVLHCHHYSPFVYGSLARLCGRAPRMVFTEHGRLSDVPPSTRRRLANLLFRRFPDRVFAVSEDLRAHLIAEGFKPQHVGVIYNGIDVAPAPDAARAASVRHRLGLAPTVLIVGTIARLDPVKDFVTLIRAMAELRQRVPAALVMIGDGPERQRLEDEARACGVAQHIHFIGYRDDAREWLAGCDVYVNSSVSEGISLTILEAMAAGLPVVATRVGGTPEVVVDGCGILVAPRDPAAIANALSQLAMRRSLGHDLGRAGRERVEQHFSLDRMVATYRGVYQELAQLAHQ